MRVFKLWLIRQLMDADLNKEIDNTNKLARTQYLQSLDVVLKSISARTHVATDLIEQGDYDNALRGLKSLNRVLPKPTAEGIAIALDGASE